MQSSFAVRRKAALVTTLVLVSATLGLAISATVAPAQAGKAAVNGMLATAGNKATPNPIPPKAVRDHRRPVCSPWAKTPDDCRRRPYRL